MEGKLAEPASKRPLALTIGAAAVTLLVIIGVLSGPSVVTCFNSSEGMGQCLRGKMVEVGLIPAPPATTVADAEAAPQGTVNVAVPEASSEPTDAAAVSPEPELAVEPPPSEPLPPTAEEPSTPVEDVVAATFGLLRAEPDGSVVIAGSGTPGSEVQVFANGELLGSITVEPSGDWVFVPDAPLPPGGLEITLGEVGKPGTSAESFIVVIDEDKTEQPLVVASTPGEASEVLQGLTAPDVEEQPLQTAQADIAPPEAEAVPPLEGAADAVAEASPLQAEEEASTEGDTVTAALPPEAVAPQPSAAESAAPQDAASTPAANDASSEPVSSASSPETQVPPAEQQAETPAVTPDEALPAAAPTETTQRSSPPVETSDDNALASASGGESASPADPEEEIAALGQPLETPQASVPQVSPPTIDAIEIEGDRSFFAGAGPEGATVRLYVDNAFVADTTVSEGRWLVEAGPVLDAPSQRVRVDLLEPGSAEVAARAEVNFVVEVPQSGQQVQVAQAETPTPTASSAAETSGETTNPSPASAAPAPNEEPADTPAVSTTAAPTEPVAAPAPASAPAATPGPASTESQPAIDATASADLPDSTEPESSSEPAPRSSPAPQPVDAPAPAAPASDPAPVTAPATPTVEPEPAVPDATMDAAAAPPAAPVQTTTTPVDPSPAADLPSTPATAVAPSPAEPASPAAEPEIPTMVAVSLGDPEAQRFASGKAIIRRGDNLWTIARRVYGEGIKYTTIYDANTGQIRDPDRIYPGQVFDLPNGG